VIAEGFLKLIFELTSYPLGRLLYGPKLCITILGVGALINETAAFLAKPKVLIEATELIRQVPTCPLVL
jgi:hypothetical protein